MTTTLCASEEMNDSIDKARAHLWALLLRDVPILFLKLLTACWSDSLLFTCDLEKEKNICRSQMNKNFSNLRIGSWLGSSSVSLGRECCFDALLLISICRQICSRDYARQKRYWCQIKCSGFLTFNLICAGRCHRAARVPSALLLYLGRCDGWVEWTDSETIIGIVTAKCF